MAEMSKPIEQGKTVVSKGGEKASEREPEQDQQHEQETAQSRALRAGARKPDQRDQWQQPEITGVIPMRNGTEQKRIANLPQGPEFIIQEVLEGDLSGRGISLPR